MIFDLVDVVLLCLVAAAITVIITKPPLRAAAGGVLAFVIGLFAGRRVPPKKAEQPPEPPEFESSHTPITVPIPNPNFELEEDLHDEYSTIDSLPADDLADELARLEQRARDEFGE